MLIAREVEQKALISAADSELAQLVAVYGRRRVGKTFLVRETFDYKFTFYHTGLSDGTFAEQLQHFQSSLRKYGWEDAPLPKNWLEAFDYLERLLSKSEDVRRIVFIDELPWMDTQNSRFMTAFEAFWNGWASAEKHLTVIVCGSATSWMINKIIKNYGGLHNRVGTNLFLAPFTLRECELFAQAQGLVLSRKQMVDGYMVFGGVPYYWSLLSPSFSLDQNIDLLFFKEDGVLSGEFKALYHSVFKNPEPYIDVITTLGQKKVGMTMAELSESMKININGHLSEVLDDLCACGFIREYTSYGKIKKNSVFQLIDNYSLFYFQFIKHRKGHDEHFWTNSQGSSLIRTWSGLAYERVVLQHLNQIKAALGISGVVANAQSWRSSGKPGAQIDLLIDRADGIINICEIKYSGKEYEISAADEENLRNKRERFIEETNCRKAVHITLVTTYGITRGMYSNIAQSVITFTQLFQ